MKNYIYIIESIYNGFKDTWYYHANAHKEANAKLKALVKEKPGAILSLNSQILNLPDKPKSKKKGR